MCFDAPKWFLEVLPEGLVGEFSEPSHHRAVACKSAERARMCWVSIDLGCRRLRGGTRFWSHSVTLFSLLCA